MRRKLFFGVLLIILIFIILGLGFLFFGFNSKKPQDYLSDDKAVNVCFNKNFCVISEIAYSNEKKRLGLMHRDFLGENNGMLFVYDAPGIYSFWMSETQLPLDIVWISSDMKIVDIANAIPCPEGKQCVTYVPKQKAQYVLEVNSGFMSKNEIRIGDEVGIIDI